MTPQGNSNTQLTPAMRRLLLVEDDRLIISTLTSGLVRAGYLVSSVESVDEAEVWLENNERPDLVLLDVRMPGRNGLELTDRLEELHHIPFIMLTAHSEQDIIKQATKSGAMGFMVKPVDITQLIPAIETALSRSLDFQGLRGENQQLQTALDADRSISVAVGIIMDQRGIGRVEAMELLRKAARSQHIKLVDLAMRIVSSLEILNLGNGG